MSRRPNFMLEVFRVRFARVSCPRLRFGELYERVSDGGGGGWLRVWLVGCWLVCAGVRLRVCLRVCVRVFVSWFVRVCPVLG